MEEPKFLTEEDIEKYRSKLVSGASIQEFNEVINAILVNLNFLWGRIYFFNLGRV